MANLIFYAADLDTNQQVVVPQADLPSVPPSGPAGGGLAGTYPNPTVAAVPDSALSSNVPLMTLGVLPAADASLLTNVKGTQSGTPGTVAFGVGSLDVSGEFGVVAGTNVPDPILPATQFSIIPVPIDPTGILTVNAFGQPPLGTVTIISLGGAADSGKSVMYVAVYA